MFASLVTGHGKAPFQISQDSDGFRKEAVSALDAEDLTMHLTLGVREVAVELATSKVMAKYETSATGIAKVHLRRLCQPGQELEVSIVQ